jgi:tetratricopeptide (TPR) repeat protein
VEAIMPKKKRTPAAVSAACLALLLLVVTGAGDASTQQRRATNTQPQQSASDALALANLYYTSNDVSDRAATEYRRVRDGYRRSKESATAQYFLASYYQRKFYIIKEKSGYMDASALTNAAREYDAYAGTYARYNSSELLADARFNLSLVYMQLGKIDEAVRALRWMGEDASKDGSVYIRHVVWASDPKEVIDASFNARELAEFTRTQLQQTRSLERTVHAVKEWCWNNRDRKRD